MRLALGDGRWIGTTEFLALERECAAQAAKIAEKDAYINTLKAIMVEQDKRLGRYENEDGPNLHLQCLRNEKGFQAKIAALEAEVQRLNDIVIGFMGDGTESPDLAPFVALAKAASEYRRLSLCRNNYPNTYNEAWWKAGSNLVDALADPAIQRAVTEAG